MAARIVWRYLHLWLGVGCSLSLLVLGVSGSALLFAPELDKLTRSALYATHEGDVTQPLSAYINAGGRSVPDGDPVMIRWPDGSGSPLTMLLRLRAPEVEAADVGELEASRRDQPRADTGTRGGAQDPGSIGHNGHNVDVPRQRDKGQNTRGARPRMLMAYLDPPTAQVLGTADPRGGFVGWVRSLHTDLLLPMFDGRQIVGWIGIGLAILSLSGICLWWPRNAGFLRGLAWCRSPKIVTNLHHRIGFWIAVPTAIMAVTGVYQAFPQQGQALIAVIAPVSQNGRQGLGASLLSHPRLSPQEALNIALKNETAYKPRSLAFPSGKVPSWRVQLASDDGKVLTLLVEDASGSVSFVPQQLRGDAVLGYLQQIHEHARDQGPVWTIIVLSTGLALPTLLITGLIIWLRRRKAGATIRAMKAGSRPVTAAAE